jgi:hypothetical protein
MQKVEGSSPFSRSHKSPAKAGRVEKGSSATPNEGSWRAWRARTTNPRPPVA